MWKGTKLSNLRSTITNMELQNLKSGAPHVELCGYIIELWYSAILEFCSHIKTVGSQILRARVKWFSRYLALSREGHNSGIQDHRPALPGVYNSQVANSMLSDNRGTYVSRISTHIDIAPATNHNKQHCILIIMQQNCQITRCARQHTMDSVLKSAKLRVATSQLDRKQNWLHACAVGPARPGFTKVGWASRWQIRESHFK